MARALEHDDVATTIAIAEILGSLPGWTWRLDGDAYTEADGACVWYGAYGPSPDVAIGLRLTGGPSRDEHVAYRRLQTRIRGTAGDPMSADRTASSFVIPVLTSIVRRAGIAGISHLTGTSLGADDNERPERSENFLITLDNPEASP